MLNGKKWAQSHQASVDAILDGSGTRETRPVSARGEGFYNRDRWTARTLAYRRGDVVTGGPEVLEYVDLPDPTPGPGEVLVKAVSFGVGKPDYLLRSGIYKWMPELPSQENMHVATCLEGAIPMFQMLEAIEGAGFKVSIIEDHSALLRQLGTATAFSGRRKQKTGYCMIVAKKY